jgi:hypothetical protein
MVSDFVGRAAVCPLRRVPGVGLPGARGQMAYWPSPPNALFATGE